MIDTDIYKKQIHLPTFITSNSDYRHYPRESKQRNGHFLYYMLKRKDANGKTLDILSVFQSTSLDWIYKNLTNPEDKGNIFTFCKHYLGLSFKESADLLSDFSPDLELLSVVDTHGEKKKPVSTNVRALTNFNYLLSRYIPQHVISDPIFDNQVFNSVSTFKSGHTITNTAFAIRDFNDQILGYSYKNTNYHSMSPDMERNGALWHSNLTTDTQNFIIGESAIDMQAYHSLFKVPYPGYFSTEGRISNHAYNYLNQFIECIQPQSIVLANDNDPPGYNFDFLYLGHFLKKSHLVQHFNSHYNKQTNMIELHLKTQDSYLIKHFNESYEVHPENNSCYLIPYDVTIILQALNFIKALISNPSIHIHKPKSKDFQQDLENSSTTSV